MGQKVLFIDRDGTVIVEPHDFQIDSLEKLEFVKGAISGLRAISGLDYKLVMATNQDGLGTDSFPEDAFRRPHDKMLKTLQGEGVAFSDILIDRSFESDGAPTRKPATGMFTEYLGGDYDLENSYVIGDRLSDVALAKNLGARAILFQPKPLTDTQSDAVLTTDSWAEIAEFLRAEDRTATIERRTCETQIRMTIDLDGTGRSNVDTGLNFLNHMIEQIVYHGGVNLDLKVKGDLNVDEHHTVEDTAIALGEVIYKALGSKRGIERYGYALPMDDARAMVLLDFGGRIEFQWDAEFRREKIGDVPTEMFRHFFKSLSEASRCNLHITAAGENEHHKIEAIFKAFARALKMAVKQDVFSYELPSSKGVL